MVDRIRSRSTVAALVVAATLMVAECQGKNPIASGHLRRRLDGNRQSTDIRSSTITSSELAKDGLLCTHDAPGLPCYDADPWLLAGAQGPAPTLGPAPVPQAPAVQQAPPAPAPPTQPSPPVITFVTSWLDTSAVLQDPVSGRHPQLANSPTSAPMDGRYPYMLQPPTLPPGGSETAATEAPASSMADQTEPPSTRTPTTTGFNIPTTIPKAAPVAPTAPAAPSLATVTTPTKRPGSTKNPTQIVFITPTVGPKDVTTMTNSPDASPVAPTAPSPPAVTSPTKVPGPTKTPTHIGFTTPTVGPKNVTTTTNSPDASPVAPTAPSPLAVTPPTKAPGPTKTPMQIGFTTPTVGPKDATTISNAPDASPVRLTSSKQPSNVPSDIPSALPSYQPSGLQMEESSLLPSLVPTRSGHPSITPSDMPSLSTMIEEGESLFPTVSSQPSFSPSDSTLAQITDGTSEPSPIPSGSNQPSVVSSDAPGSQIASPTMSSIPSMEPSYSPMLEVSSFPSKPSSGPPTLSSQPSGVPSDNPSLSPYEQAAVLPSMPSLRPSGSSQPSRTPSDMPSKLDETGPGAVTPVISTTPEVIRDVPITFYVSNTDGFTEDMLNNLEPPQRETLEAAFQLFVQKLIKELYDPRDVEVILDSEKIAGFSTVDCSQGASEGAICHRVSAGYEIAIRTPNHSSVVSSTLLATEAAIHDGELSCSILVLNSDFAIEGTSPCDAPMAEDAIDKIRSPTVSAYPSAPPSVAPSTVELTSARPTTVIADFPTVSSRPSGTPSDATITVDPAPLDTHDVTDFPTTSAPEPASGTITLAPVLSNEPVVRNVPVTFFVSNTGGLTEDLLNGFDIPSRQTLEFAFQTFAEKLMQDLYDPMEVTIVPWSDKIFSFSTVDCSGEAIEGTICHQVSAGFEIMIRVPNSLSIVSSTLLATDAAIRDGELTCETMDLYSVFTIEGSSPCNAPSENVVIDQVRKPTISTYPSAPPSYAPTAVKSVSNATIAVDPAPLDTLDETSLPTVSSAPSSTPSDVRSSVSPTKIPPSKTSKTTAPPTITGVVREIPTIFYVSNTMGVTADQLNDNQGLRTELEDAFKRLVTKLVGEIFPPSEVQLVTGSAHLGVFADTPCSSLTNREGATCQYVDGRYQIMVFTDNYLQVVTHAIVATSVSIRDAGELNCALATVGSDLHVEGAAECTVPSLPATN